MLMNYRVGIIIFIIIFFFFSCKYNYSEGNVSDTLNENIPNIIIKNAKITFVRGTTVSISAQNIEIYSKQKRQEISELSFSEIDKQGNVRMYGNAENASIETDTNNVTITGNIFVRSNKDETQIESEYLRWLDEDRKIEGSPTQKIILTRDDGSRIEGKGFIGDAKKRTLSFTKRIFGKLVVEEDNEN